MERKSVKEAMTDGMDRMVNELARYRRMVELNPEMHEMTVEGFDALLNEKCDAAFKKYSKMDLGEVLLDGLVTALAADAKINGPESAGKNLADLFKGMGDN